MGLQVLGGKESFFFTQEAEAESNRYLSILFHGQKGFLVITAAPSLPLDDIAVQRKGEGESASVRFLNLHVGTLDLRGHQQQRGRGVG